MSRYTDIITAHKAQLGEAIKLFTAANDADFIRQLQAGAKRLIVKRPYLKRTSVMLVSDQGVYPAAADLDRLSRYEWGVDAIGRFKPWNPDWPGPFPEISTVQTDQGPELVFQPPPTGLQIETLGAQFYYWYYALHVLSANLVTILPQDESVLLLAALIEAVRELSTRNVVNPVQLHKGMVPTATAQTPLAWYQELSKEWERLP